MAPFSSLPQNKTKTNYEMEHKNYQKWRQGGWREWLVFKLSRNSLDPRLV